MINRIYDKAELDCSCIIEHAPVGLVRCDVLKLSSQKAVVPVPFDLPVRHRLEVVLEFRAHSISKVIPVRVEASENGVIHFCFEILDSAEVFELNQLLHSLAKKQLTQREEEIRRRLSDYKPKPKVRRTPIQRKPGPRKSIIEDVQLAAKIPALKPSQMPSAPIRVDGQIDFKASVRSQTKTIPIHKLAEKHAHVQVLNIDRISQLATQAADEALQQARLKFTEKERKQLLEESETLFQERLAEYQLEKKDLKTQATEFQRQLKQAEELLTQERMQVIHSDRFTVSDEGLVQLDQRMKYLLDQAVGKGKIDSVAQQEMRDLISHLLDGERDLIKSKALEAQSDKVDLLQRKIDRLSRNLEETGKERDSARNRLLQFENQPGAVNSIMEAGLDEEDPLKLDKLALLAELVEDNQAIRTHMNS